MADEKVTLRRSLGLLETTLGGVGIILGAGIYALVGEVAAKSGDAMWISFAMAGLMAAVVGLSYAELASAFPKAGADYEYTRRAFGQRPAFVVGWLIVIGNVVAASAVALAFGGYFGSLFDADVRLVAVAALVIATVIAFYGIRETLWTSIVLTLVEAGGLILIIVIGVPHFGDVDLLEANKGASGIFAGGALVMFAFIGFEQVATLAEETRNPGRVIPRAMLLAIAISCALYLLVAIASISVLGWERLSSTDAPLAEVAKEALGGSAFDVIAVVALFSTANTILLMLVAASRMMYGMASTEALPRFLAWVHPGVQTPARAIVICLIISVGFALSGDLSLVAGATNFAIFVGFGAVNASLIVLRYTHANTPRPFRVPLNIGRLPVLPVIALASVVFMMANLETNAILIGFGLFVLGIVAMQVLSLWRPQSEAR
ncbi:MAG TPA: APC family permease [Dehalococcoidia bacterium]